LGFVFRSIPDGWQLLLGRRFGRPPFYRDLSIVARSQLADGRDTGARQVAEKCLYGTSSSSGVVAGSRYRTHMAKAYFRHHSFEAHSGHCTRCGAAEILIDNFDVAPAQATQSIPHGLPQFLSFQIILNLIGRGLAHVENGISFDMMWFDLVTHSAPPWRVLS
jgi:hypothetical protein